MKNTNLFKKIFRIEAFALVFLLLLIVSIYLYFFLGLHVKWAVEKSAYESIGAEVNIDAVDIDFMNAEVEIKRIQITNPDEEKENIIEIKSILSSFYYAPLFQGSFISDLTSVKDIEFHTERSRPGRVLPKEQRILVLKDPTQNRVHNVLKDKFKKTAFSDLVGMFSSDKRKEVEDRYKESLKSLRASDEVQQETKDIEKQVDQFKAYTESDKIKKLLKKVKDFKFDSSSTSSSVKSAGAVLSLTKELKKERSKFKAKLKAIKAKSSALKTKMKSSPNQFLADVKGISSSLSPSKLSPDKITEDVLSEYFSVQLGQVARATNSIKNDALGSGGKYVDLSDKKETPKTVSDEEGEASQLNLEKEKEKLYSTIGKDFVFFKGVVLPKYWLKRIEISSKASESQDLGDVTGLITNFSDAPWLTGKEMIVDVVGSVPKQGIGKFKIDAKIDHRNVNKKSEVVKVNVSDYIVKGLELFKASDDVMKIAKANSSTTFDVSLNGDIIDLSLFQRLKAPTYDVSSKDKNILALFNTIKAGGEELTFTLKATGVTDGPKISMRSNLGDIILKAVKDNVTSQASDFAAKQLSKLNEQALEKLSPLLKKLDLADLKAGDLNKDLEKKIKEGLDKVQKQKGSGKKSKKDELLKKLFDKL